MTTPRNTNKYHSEEKTKREMFQEDSQKKGYCVERETNNDIWTRATNECLDEVISGI